MATCGTCGALLGDAEKHNAWHRAQGEKIQQAAQTTPCRRCRGTGRQPGLFNACGRCGGTGVES